MLPKYAIHHRSVIEFCVFLIVIGGIYSYFTMGRLEDPEYTVKTAVVVTFYPGADPEAVADNVTSVIEEAAQQIKGFKTTRSLSKPGQSIVFVELLETFPVENIDKAWVELRNKMDIAALKLPIEAFTPIVNDDFGEVYGIVLALSADGYSDAELRDAAQDIQKKLLLADQVKRIVLWGLPEEQIEVEISQAKMTELAVHPQMVYRALAAQNLKITAGEMSISGERIRINPSGTFESIEEIENLIIPDGIDAAGLAQLLVSDVNPNPILDRVSSNNDKGTRQIRLKDVATVRRVAVDEPSKVMRINGKRAVVLALSPIPNGDVIKMGKQVHEQVDNIMKTYPAGYRIDTVCYQPDTVNAAIHAFTKNLREAIIIVTLVVMVAMGWRSGLLIASSLLLVILGTLCVLAPMGIILQRTTLGAFIVALGILVDDAVVVGDLILVRMQRGVEKTQACIDGARRAANQLLGATIVGALAFLPVYLSPDDTGEYAKDIFIVLAISLMISWFVAMLQTPVVYHMFISPKKGVSTDPHAGPVFRAYRRMLESVLHHKTLALVALLGLLVLAGVGFQRIPQIFFPRTIRTQFMVDYWLPEGSSVNSVEKDVTEIERYIMAQPGVVNVASFLGGGPPRFYLPYEPEIDNTSYGQLVVNTEAADDVDKLLKPIEDWIKANYPQAEARTQRFALGPTTKLEIEARYSGPDPAVLHSLADQAKEILRREPTAKFVRDNWRQKVPTWSPEFSQAKGARGMISRAQMQMALLRATVGIPTGFYADGENLLPIKIRSAPSERNRTDTLRNTPVWGYSPVGVPLDEVTDDLSIHWEEGIIHRRNRIPTITVGADTNGVEWTTLLKKVKPQIESIPLPEGYRLEWGGQAEKSRIATGFLLKQLPIALVLMALIVVVLFNGLRQLLIILMTFPLASIGITFGLLLFRQPFGFMVLVGAMSLLGMMVRNGVVLMDKIDEELRKRDDPYHAVVDASVERMRPVTVAAMTVVVGMIPLLHDPLFGSMAIAIMFGLIFATVLTLFVVPIFYLILFRIKVPKKQKRGTLKTSVGGESA
ncbi:MAG: efflux RND transporter permease subunit [Thermoguttaceae bacterium]|jgi:multidrug efflux pump subunit AcrB